MNPLVFRLVKPKVAGSWKRVLLDAGCVVVAGLLLSWVANALSPRGLELSRDYFPSLPSAVTPPQDGEEGSGPDAGAASTSQSGPAPVQPAPTLASAGAFPFIDFEAAVKLLESPGAQDGRIVFVDARSSDHHGEGHLPGAYVLDRFYPERFLPDVLPAVMTAEQVVVYCTGGDCEDSEYAAQMLREAGVPADRLLIYKGGIEEWRLKGGTVERGERLSGLIEPVQP